MKLTSSGVEIAGSRINGRISEPEHGTDIYRLFHACQSVDEACRLTRDWFSRLFPGLSGDISLFSGDHEFLERSFSWGDAPSRSESFRPADCWAIRRGRPHHVGARWGTEMASCDHYDHDSDGWHLCLPLMASGESLGFLHLHGSDYPDDISAAGKSKSGGPCCKLEDVTESLSLTIAGLKQRELLQHQAIRDPLTQLFNRRYLEDTLARELDQAARANEPLVFAILDVDYFKKFNDQNGHDAGDALLRAIGDVLLGSMRGGDIACRFGGEEFALVYPGMDEDVAVKRLESIRLQIGKLSLSHRGQSCPSVTISAGIAVFPQHGPDSETLINVADKALYKSKESGRNRVTTALETEPNDEVTPLRLVHDAGPDKSEKTRAKSRDARSSR